MTTYQVTFSEFEMAVLLFVVNHALNGDEIPDSFRDTLGSDIYFRLDKALGGEPLGFNKLRKRKR